LGSLLIQGGEKTRTTHQATLVVNHAYLGRLPWTDNAADATSCEVDRTTDGQTWTTLATLDPGATSYNDTGLTDSAMYAYRVRAINSVGGSGYAVNATSTLPTAPGNLEGTAVSGTEIDLSWNAAPYATGYTISMQEEGSDNWDVIGTVPASQTTFAATGLAPGGTEYAFCVAPTNSTSGSAVAYIDPATLNQRPIVAVSPSAVLLNPTSAALSVLGADDGGENNLTYSWSVLYYPLAGGAYFSVNNSNAAKNTTVTFYAAGDFTFQVTITDALGAQVQSTVDVFVPQVQTGVTVSPTDEPILTGDSAQFTATALDQFGNAMTPQQPFTWSLGDDVGDLAPWGSDSQSATYTAPASGGNASFALTVSSGGTAATANLAVIPAPDPDDDWIEDGAAGSVGSNSVDSPYDVAVAGPSAFTFHDFSKGNVFKVYDNGVLILTTTLVGGYAYGQVMLAAGAHALTVNWASQGQPGNGDEFDYGINQEALLGLTVWDNSSDNNTATAITDGVVKTLVVAGIPLASDPTTLTASVCVSPGITQNTDENVVYVSIKRENDSGQTDQTLYYGPLSKFTFADCPLTANSRTVDFVILEWVDDNGDGECDPGDDSREVDVSVVTPWTAVGTWTAGQAAMVEANANGASLSQLAWDITGNHDDAYGPGDVGTITNGKQIDVSGLLNVLDSTLHSYARAVATSPKAAAFGRSPGLPPAGMGEKAVNAVFNASTPQPWPTYNCSGMVQLEMAETVILTLEAGRAPQDYLYEFDKMGLTVGIVSFVATGGMSTFSSSQYFTVFSPAVARSALQPGDWVRFWNRADYKQQQPLEMWNAESTVMVGADSYYGWTNAPEGNPTAGGKTMSYAQWKQELVDAYNKGLGCFSTITTAQIQGYDDVPTNYLANYLPTMNQVCAGFINAWALGQRVFAYRNGDSP
jgi:hypothetical protein